MAGRIDKNSTASDDLVDWNQIQYPAHAIIETERLSIRPLHILDAPTISEYANDENLSKWMTNRFPHPYTLADATSFINRFGVLPSEGKPWTQFALALKEDPRQLIGCIGIHPGSDVFCRSAELGYWVGAKYHGKGYATEATAAVVNYAFSLENGLNGQKGESLMHVSLQLYGNNVPSRRVAEKVGFAFEGVSKGAIYKRGVIHDLAMFGKTREDWMKELN